MTKTVYLAVCCFFLFVLSSTDIAAQDLSHLPPDKQAVVKQVQEKLNGSGRICFSTSSNMLIYKEVVVKALDKIDPILVGKNVVFDKKWLDGVVGDGKPLTRRQFEAWRNRVDRIYDCYEDFTGSNPGKVYIDLQPHGKFSHASTTGHAHRAGGGCLNIDSGYNKERWRAIANGFDSYVLMHEMGHAFSMGKIWCLDEESIAELMVAYAMEKGGARIDTINASNPKNHRQARYNQSLNASRGKDFPVSSEQSESPSLCRLYMFGMVEKVGWDVYKQTIHSYDGVRFSIGEIPILDFIKRLEHFSGKPILRTLPDKGALLDKGIGAERVNTYIPKNLQPKVANAPVTQTSGTAPKLTTPTVTPPTVVQPPVVQPTTTTPAPTDKPRRTFVNAPTEYGQVRLSDK